jgi:cytochrome c oxidase assembly protein subunit 15
MSYFFLFRLVSSNQSYDLIFTKIFQKLRNTNRKIVALWLMAGVFMIMVQVLLGGVTRLTGSGLSITEWKPIMGALPPMSDAEWNKAFDGYKEIAQYKYLNSHFTLSDFKFIFFWEWFHRLWARMLGVVFAIGFVYFLIRKYFDRNMIMPFVILFILGGLQGLIGWIMVKSGLNDSNLYVNHIKLAIHFISALVLLCYTLWFALLLLIPEEKKIQNKGLHKTIIVTLVLLAFQLLYGAFMAGLKAAPSAPTWPLINGAWIPPTFPALSWINNALNVQFIHRQLAYLLATIIIFLFGAVFRNAKKHNNVLLKSFSVAMLLLVLLQVTLGVSTVLLAPKMGATHFGSFELLAEAHQLVAMLLLCSLVGILYLVRNSKFSEIN